LFNVYRFIVCCLLVIVLLFIVYYYIVFNVSTGTNREPEWQPRTGNGNPLKKKLLLLYKFKKKDNQC